MTVELTDQNFDEEVLKSDQPILVDFWAPWCAPCQIMGPILEELAKEGEGKFRIGKLNVDENPNVAGRYGIMSIPTMKIFHKGEAVKDFVGVQHKDILKNEFNNILKG